MKQKNLTLAILVMVVATLVSVAIVSCKKEDTVAPTGQHAAKAAFTPPQVDDMNAYLKDFKQRMQSAAKGDDEALSLDEAAWHLSSVANYDFGHVNVEFDDVRFDTLYAHVDITNGTVFLSDLCTAYEGIHGAIDSFFQKLNLNEKHLRFIDAEIAEDGFTVISLITSFVKDSKGWGDCHWYPTPYLVDPFNDSIAESICDSLFNEYALYVWNGFGMTELQRLLNLTEHHETTSENSHNLYFTITRVHTFEYLDNIDPYGSPSNFNSRLFGVMGNFNYKIPKMDMCYYLDSYLGLGYQYLADNPNALYVNECPAVWSVIAADSVFYPNYAATYFHKLKVTYCCTGINGSGTD